MMVRPASKPWKVEYSKSARSLCKTCKKIIAKEILRLGKMVPATQFNGFVTRWNHATCILKKPNRIKFTDDVEGIELLRWEDQEKIREYVESGDGGPPGRNAAKLEYGIEVSQTSRATCKACRQKIMTGEVRLSSGAKVLAWHHGHCFVDLYPSIQVEKLSGWENLSASDQAAVQSLVKKVPPPVEAADGEKVEELRWPIPKACRKRRSNVRSKRKSRGEGDDSTSRFWAAIPEKDCNFESELEARSKALWALKDYLKDHATTIELRAMLEANGQNSTGSQLDLRDRCAAGMMFGALVCCPICSGSLRYSGDMYRCQGYLSEWSKCTYSTYKPKRVEGKWRIPEEINNHYLSKGEWKCIIDGVGGQFPAEMKKGGAMSYEDVEMRKAKSMKLTFVKEDYVIDRLKTPKKHPLDSDKIEPLCWPSMVTVRVKGRSAVHEYSGMQETGHILEDGKSIYNTTLNMSDLSTGVNKYYILQIIQDDKGSRRYVFRQWGQLGDEKFGGSKLEEMSKSDAINKFKHLFLEKTGNPWDTWEQKRNIQKKPGRYFPLDIDYGVPNQVTKKKRSLSRNQLAPPVVELMKMLFNIETYRTEMMEFKIDMSAMPLGKLSKNNIQRGFEILSEIQNLLNSDAHDLSVKENLIIDASSKFFTTIPSIYPHVIRDEDDLRSKVKMLETLQDIEVASRLVGFDADSDDSLDDKYKKLHCDISPLPHDSEDYQLIEKYLLTTIAPTHTDWHLKLEEVFSLEREEESDRFAPHREKLKNRMLLWHGSRLTNFVGILSQGLRIAPPEAPSTGYMFGKGIYFADLVSKSAQYCHTTERNPVGLMLLSEVALGEVYEQMNAMYMEKAPEGKHSTKGLGKKVPRESEFVKWRNDVIVPCGKPVGSNIRASELLYNEYIVYNKDQVKLQFLLKVRFHHKRRRGR